MHIVPATIRIAQLELTVTDGRWSRRAPAVSDFLNEVCAQIQVPPHELDRDRYIALWVAREYDAVLLPLNGWFPAD